MTWALALLGGGGPVGWMAAAWWLDWRGRRPPTGGPWDAIVVAGCLVGSDGRATPALARRATLAAELFHRGAAPRIVLTGGARPPHATSEAAAAAQVCRDLGVPADALTLEQRSSTTEENARFAAALVAASSVLVVSDGYHMFRCRRIFARHFPQADAIGSVPRPRQRVSMALREVAAIAAYAVQRRL